MSDEINKQMLEMMKGLTESMQTLNQRIEKVEGGTKEVVPDKAIEEMLNLQETVLAYQCELPPPRDQEGVRAQFGALWTIAGPIFYNVLACQEYGEKNIQPNYGTFRVKSFSQTMSKDYYEKNVKHLQIQTLAGTTSSDPKKKKTRSNPAKRTTGKKKTLAPKKKK